MSEVVGDAVRRMREAERAKREPGLAGFKIEMTDAPRDGVTRGIKDIEEGRYQEFDATGLRGLAKAMVVASARKLDRRSKAK